MYIYAHMYEYKYMYDYESWSISIIEASFYTYNGNWTYM